MSRTLSPVATESTNDESTAEVWLVLLTIRHPTLVEPIRVVNNFDDITSADPITHEDREFIGLPFEVALPGEEDDQPVAATIRVDNVDRQIVAALRELTSPPMADIEVVLASQPNVIEIAFYDFTIRVAEYDSLEITAQLTFEQIFTEPVAVDMTPQRVPGIF